MDTRKKRGKSGNRKHGRNKLKCGAYRLGMRREKNKLRRLRKLVKTHPRDKQITQAIDRLDLVLKRGY